MAQVDVVIGGWKCSASEDGQYLYVSRPGNPGEVHIKAECEGLVVDLWSAGDEPACVASAAAAYNDMAENERAMELTDLYGDVTRVEVYFTPEDMDRIRNMRQALFDNLSGGFFHPTKVRLQNIGLEYTATGIADGEYIPCVELVYDKDGMRQFWRATRFDGIEDHFGGQFKVFE